MVLIFLRAFEQDFFDHVRWWYKRTVLAFLFTSHFCCIPSVTGWCFVLEFIFTLAMALKSYPLQPGGLFVPLSNADRTGKTRDRFSRSIE